MLPFDGIADWQAIARNMKKFDYNGALTFELLSKSRPGSCANDKYLKYSAEEFIGHCYERACKFRDIYLQA